MLEVDRRNKLLLADERIFPEWINEDADILFHGCSNVVAEEILKEGFQWADRLYTRLDVQAVLDVLEAMDWMGLGSDAYLALSSYTMARDFADSQQKPTFFSDIAEGAVGYTKRFAGETAGCLLYAIENLRAFMQDDIIRKEYRRDRYLHIHDAVRGLHLPLSLTAIAPEEASASHCMELKKYIESKIPNIKYLAMLPCRDDQSKPFEAWEEDLGWLAEKLTGFEALEARLRNAQESHEYGVVYAVRLEPSDRHKLKNLNTGLQHGLAFYGTLPASRIVARALISAKQPRLNTHWRLRSVMNAKNRA